MESKKRQAPISQFFTKRIATEENTKQPEPIGSCSVEKVTPVQQDPITITQTGHCNKYDVFNYVNKVLDANERKEFLNNVWVPEPNHVFPVSKRSEVKGKKLKFQFSWLSRWTWLCYSQVEDGAYCKYCIIFSKHDAGKSSSQQLGSLCKKKFDNWKKAVDNFNHHSQTQYHRNCVQDADELLSSTADKSIDLLIDNDRSKKILENRQKMVPIIDTVITCGRQELALRGHRDSGKIFSDSEITTNEGNFRALIRYRALGDPNLKQAMESEGQRNKYTSPSIQNEIIEDGDGEKDEEVDLLEPPCTATTVGSDDEKTDNQPSTKIKFSFINPFVKKKKPEEVPAEIEGGEIPIEKRPGFLHAIKLPLVSVLPRKLKSMKEPDVEEGGGGSTTSKPAGLASMETLDDSNGSTKLSDDKTDEGLETVKLDSSVEEKAALDAEKSPDEKKPWDRNAVMARLAPLKEFKFIIAGVIIFRILLIIIVVVAITGPRPVVASPRPMVASPIIDGRYVRAVTSCGEVEGILEDGAAVFRGIPYARSPTGDRRWRKPEPFLLETCWNNTLKAHNSTDTCWQVYSNGTINGNEDCLTLDIITPQVRYLNPLPVVVLFGADSLTGGSPGSLVLPPPRLSRIRDVVFVRPNFRMGVLGYLATKALTNSTYPHTSGNYGLLDMVEALRWVKHNIVHFAGDPIAITVLGHRAGATMLTAIVASHKVEDLFAQAWLSSGSAVFPKEELVDSERQNQDQFVRKLNCNERDDACLRRLDVEELIDHVPESWRKVAHDLPRVDEALEQKHQWLVQDGVIIREDPTEVLKRGNLSVKVVMGTTAHADATKLVFDEKPEGTEEEVKMKIANSLIGSNVTEVLTRYNATWAGLASIISDIRTICPLLHLARQIPSTPFYVATEPRGKSHVADVNADVDAILEHYVPRTPEQRRFAVAIQQIFYRFVTLGKFDQHPSDASNNKILLIGQDALTHPDYPNCDMWIANEYVPRYARID